jgi:hypothetical protein
MNWLTLKDLVVKEFAVKAMAALCVLIRVIEKVSKEKIEDIRFYKFKTKNYHVRIMMDTTWQDPFILFRKKGFLKEWVCMDRSDVPEFLARDIFSDSCDEKKRKRLVSKMMELKAFW